MPTLDLTILMPCLNEVETLERCIAKAKMGLIRAGVTGEILIADNGSTDGSQELATRLGARVVNVTEKGYGNALRGGIEAAEGKWILMGDADDSYDFSEAPRFVARLAGGCDVVMGCRLPSGGGVIVPGAMPWKNRWLGNPVLSFLGRLFFRTSIRDFHCGLRAFTKSAYLRMAPRTTGMEFASEMVMKAAVMGMQIAEVPVTLHKDGRSRPPHLRPWRDGWRHLRFMLIYSPRQLFLIPGLLLGAGGALTAAALYFDARTLISGSAEIATFAFACAAAVIGCQLVALAFFTKVFGESEGLLPSNRQFARLFRQFTLERGILVGALLLLLGVLKLVSDASQSRVWQFAPRNVVAASTVLLLGVQVMSSSFFMSILGLRTVSRTPPQPERE